MKIVVTQEHIDRGSCHRKDGSQCAIAQAMLDAGLAGAFINIGYAHWTKNGVSGATDSIPEEAQTFIQKYDSEPPYPVEPFEFELEVE